MRQKRASFFALVFLCFCATANAEKESITITTYYPSPAGSYHQLNVGSGGLKLGRVVDKTIAGKWNTIDTIRMPAGGLYVISVIPLNGDKFFTYMILFSAGIQGIDISVFDNSGYLNSLVDSPSAKFRGEAINDSFNLEINPVKDCKVHIGKLLSYWP